MVESNLNTGWRVDGDTAFLGQSLGELVHSNRGTETSHDHIAYRRQAIPQAQGPVPEEAG